MLFRRIKPNFVKSEKDNFSRPKQEAIDYLSGTVGFTKKFETHIHMMNEEEEEDSMDREFLEQRKMSEHNEILRDFFEQNDF